MGPAIGSCEGKKFMTKQKHTTGQGKKPKRSFARLDREKALKAAAGPVGVLRKIFTASTRMGYVLELVETELNDILRFSDDRRLPDEIFCDTDAVVVPADLGEARKSAAGAVTALRKLWRDAQGDLSVDESQCSGLESALDRLEEALNELLPPPGLPPRAKLPDDLFDEAGVEAVPVDIGSGL